MFLRKGQPDTVTDRMNGEWTLPECIAMFERVPIFARLSKRDLRQLVALGIQRTYPAGAQLIEQGRPSAGLFLVLRGRLAVTQWQTDASLRELATLGTGAMVGEMALVHDLPRAATVTAIEPTHVFMIPVFDFRMALRANTETAIRLLVILSRREVGLDSPDI
jgi:CRP-like cAMP-binding protein